MNLGTIIMAAGMILGELLDSDDEDSDSPKRYTFLDR